MKKMGILAVLLLILPFCSCSAGPVRTVNLQDRAIVQSVGVDWDGKEFSVTMQVFSPDGSGGQTMVDASKQNAGLITCRGKSIAEAVEESARHQGKEFYLGHNRIVVLGWEAAQLPLEKVLSYFVNSLDSRPDVNMLVTRGTARKILETPITQSILPAMSIEKTIANAQRNGFTQEVFLIDVLEAMASDFRGALIPVIEAREPEDEREYDAIRIGGMVLFNGKGCEGEIPEENAAGVLLLRNQLKSVIFTLHTPRYRRAAVQLSSVKTKLTGKLMGDVPVFRAEISGEWTLLEKEMEPGAAFTEDSLKELETALSEQIEDACREAFRLTALERGCDVFQLGERLRREDPARWERISGSWSEYLRRGKLTCKAESRIGRIGLEAAEKTG